MVAKREVSRREGRASRKEDPLIPEDGPGAGWEGALDPTSQAPSAEEEDSGWVSGARFAQNCCSWNCSASCCRCMNWAISA